MILWPRMLSTTPRSFSDCLNSMFRRESLDKTCDNFELIIFNSFTDARTYLSLEELRALKESNSLRPLPQEVQFVLPAGMTEALWTRIFGFVFQFRPDEDEDEWCGGCPSEDLSTLARVNKTFQVSVELKPGSGSDSDARNLRCLYCMRIPACEVYRCFSRTLKRSSWNRPLARICGPWRSGMRIL